MTSLSEEPAWKQRAVERSLRTVKLRAEQRVQSFLDAAQAIITEKGSTDFTVQEVVDRSRQSLRSFYLQFDGKHELLLALFEEALSRTAEQLRAAAEAKQDPLSRLQITVELLFELCRPDQAAQRPLFTDFAPQLMVTHPSHVRVAYVPIHALFTELVQEAKDAGELRQDLHPRRTAALIMQAVMFTAQSTGGLGEESQFPLTAEEVWNLYAHGIVSK